MQDNRKISKLSDLRFADTTTKWINAITLYRIIAFPVLIGLIITKQFDVFKWLLIVSFLTDAVDGVLARKYNANSVLGAKLDSIGDDLTILAGLIGFIVAKHDFLSEQWLLFAIPFGLFIVQLCGALIRYGKISSYHTYLAKLAAILQGFFMCAMFLFQQPAYWLFYLAVFVTTIELIEEIIILIVLPEWKTNIHGLYWVWKDRQINQSKTKRNG